MKILVTGTAGFIGFHLAQRLLARGDEVNRKLELTFEDGLCAVVEMDRLLKNYPGVFAPLLDEEYFQQVKVDTELGTIVWPNGADVCPDVLYSQASGKPIDVQGIDASR